VGAARGRGIRKRPGDGKGGKGKKGASDIIRWVGTSRPRKKGKVKIAVRRLGVKAANCHGANGEGVQKEKEGGLPPDKFKQQKRGLHATSARDMMTLNLPGGEEGECK